MEKENLKENIDFYLDEKGRTVFTASYLLKRGYCCESGCRHCPYGFKEEGDFIKSKKGSQFKNRGSY